MSVLHDVLKHSVKFNLILKTFIKDFRTSWLTSGFADMEIWGLDRQYFVNCITDSASNMNSLGGLLDNWQNAPIPRHYYCSDHILQLTAVHAFSGNVTLGNGHDNSVAGIKEARNLVSHVSSSHHCF